ncbi:hypothetical protein [Sphingomonas edaphi]|uniref:Uncharacterized protein n=1 Tax=Sphingomonas edaphi TaxID=2315689 RepID=A0A418Q2Y6_9SPHN|nr:hypothetical protein [Sphingomonas edaphi]RIX32190.1 hypothetical protein D3M59_04275 [Sphingomonas edaphi]
MPVAKPPYFLSAASAKAILDAAEPAAPPSPELIESTRRWLQARVREAAERANTDRIVKADVERVARAYRRFQRVIHSLRNHDDPPPKIPTSSEGATAWDEWIDGFRVIPWERGPHESRDWQLIGALLALYEVTSGRQAAFTPNGPAMRFLDAAFDHIRPAAPRGKRSYFASPNPDALRHKLPRLRKIEMRSAAKRLARIFGRIDPE